MRRRLMILLGATAGFILVGAGPAWAGHDHFVVTPNGNCQQIAEGQTSISDPEHGGYHKFHDLVHAGATGGTTAAPYEFGDGHSRVVVYRDDCVAP